MELPADNPTHKQQRNEHRHQRDADGENGKADLTCPSESGFQRCEPLLQMTNDVFDHDDGVIHHEADGDRERHERDIVEAELEKIHHPERACQGERDGHASDERRRYSTEEAQSRP